MIVNMWEINHLLLLTCEFFFIIIEKSTEGSAVRKLLIGREDPCRCIAELVMGKEKTWAPWNSKVRLLSFALRWGKGFVFVPGVTSHFSLCLVTIHWVGSCFLSTVDAVLWMLWSSVCALVPQGCPGKQLSRWAPSRVFLWQELPREQQCRCCAAGPDQQALQWEGRGRITHKEEAARKGKERP